MLYTERKDIKSILVVIGMYILLIGGGISMVYPFLLMVSGSFKSEVDAFEFDVIPRFLYDDDLLFQKYEQAKCNTNIAIYKDNYGGSEAFSFKDIKVPSAPTETLLADWKAFCEGTTARDEFYMLGFFKGRTIPRNLRGYRERIREICRDDLAEFNRTYAPGMLSWFFLEGPSETEMTGKSYQISTSPAVSKFIEFKKECPIEDRIYVSCDGFFRKLLQIDSKYKGGIEKFNKIHGTNHESFNEICLTAKAPTAELLREHWSYFVREVVNPIYVTVEKEAKGDFQKFMAVCYGDIGTLNKAYATKYSDFSEVDFPQDRQHASSSLADYILFLKDRKSLKTEYLRLDTPELAWRDQLRRKYNNDLSSVSSAHGKEYTSFDSISFPSREVDYSYVKANSGELRRHFAVRNYQMVLEYIGTYGSGIYNTIVYCGLQILCALMINPLAAYALSRYNLPSQYKVLLFLMATMAFPPMVTAIPNFLLLKELGLLNTFAALILPGVANGYSIFLLKGFFDSLPRDLYEAAELDGATEWTKFWTISMNLSKPILAVIALTAFNVAYGNFMFAFIVCQDRKMWTLMVWLYQLQQMANQEVVFAAILIAAIPTLLVFIFCQNLIIRGIVVPTEK
jgi:multiple sugar transport system permease protein